VGERRTVKSNCLGCVGYCGAIYEVETNKIMKVKGDSKHPITGGYMCPKGRAVEEIRSSPERLRHPLKRMGAKGGGKWKQISWEEATDEIAERLIQVKEKHGPESFVLSVGALGVLAGLDHDIGKFLHLFGSPNRLVDLNI